MNTKLIKSVIASGLVIWSISALTFTNNPPNSCTGAPGESNCTSCHGGSTLNSGGALNNILLTTSVPLSSLQPNTTYTFNLSFSQAGRTKYGFQLCVLPSGATPSSSSIGTLIASSSETQLSTTTNPNRTYLMHNVSGTSAPGATKTWQFQYTTPNAINLSPVFYVAINASNGNNSSSGDLIYTKTFSSTILPVKWGDVKVFSTENGVRINWSTLTEINNHYFEVQRSLNGYDWEKIGEVKGNGNRTVPLNYTFDDVNVLPGVVYYYKLNQVDFDGQNEETPIVSAVLNATSDVIVGNFYPNPSYDISTLEIFTQNETNVSVSIVDALGKNVLDTNKYLTKGINKIQVKTNDLASGIYIATIIINDKTIQKQIVVSK